MFISLFALVILCCVYIALMCNLIHHVAVVVEINSIQFKKETVDMAILDFTKAFAKVPHKRLIIGLYRDVWIAAIASSRTRLATLTGVMCKTSSQCELRSLRVNSGMLNVIRIVTYYILPPPPIRVARLFLDCNGDFAIKAYT